MKKLRTLFVLALCLCCAAAGSAQTVQVVQPEVVNINGSEAVWLPGQIQDGLKSNLQDYLGMRTLVDSRSETQLKKLQRDAENAGRDANTAIELGKISTAQFAIMSKIRKTGKGYTLTADYTNLTTGEQLATATSKEYKTIEALYESTGAIDEITLIFAEKLHIALNPVQQQALRTGTADFSVDDQLALAKKNEEQYKKLMQQFDEQLRALSVSNDIHAAENTKKIEAEKALLAEKQKSEQKRLAELAEQKKRADEDAQLEAKRSAEQKKKRDELSAKAAKKAAEVRKQKLERQGVFGQITVIENKKKALVEIRQGVEARIQELYVRLNADKKEAETQIRAKPWSSIELENGSPTQAAKQRRDRLVEESDEALFAKFTKDAESVQGATSKLDAALLAEIRADQETIAKVRTVSSLGEELKVSYGAYSGNNSGWNVYLSLYSEGILLYEEKLMLSYEALTGKAPVNLATAKDAAIADYEATVDMYNSLLLRGDPILYFELDYHVTAAADDKPSQYEFSFDNARAISMVSGKQLQALPLGKKLTRTTKPAYDIRKTESQAIAAAKEQTPAAKRQRQKQAEKENRMLAQQGFYHTMGGGGIGGFGLYVCPSDFSISDFSGIELAADIAITSWLFLDFGFATYSEDWYPMPDNEDNTYYYYEYSYEPDSCYGFSLGVGINKRFHLYRWHPAVYYKFNMGINFADFTRYDSGYYAGYLSYDTPERELFYSYKHTFGLLLPVVFNEGDASIDIDMRYSLCLAPEISSEYVNTVSIGLKVTFPRATIPNAVKFVTDYSY